MEIPAPPTADSDRLDWRLDRLERQLAELTRSQTNSPRFWPRAWAIVGHQMAIWGILYGVFILIAIIATAAGNSS
jgi:hypothetical protein